MNLKPKSSSPEQKGLLAVGTFVVDYHKVVDHYPRERSSCRVTKEVVSNGGAPLNVLIDLAKLEVDFPLHAAAKVGQDLDGRFILDQLKEHKIETTQVRAIENGMTGYTDVYTTESTGRHSCFHFSAIGDTFSRKDIKLNAVHPKILFLGSLGALGKLDNHNSDYGRKGATQLLRDAHKQDITTVVDIAPIDRITRLQDYAESLAEADYLIVSDRITEELTGVELYSENSFDPRAARLAGQKFLSTGLRKAVIIQSGTIASYIGADGTIHRQKGFFLPWDKRKGSAGVDHAFAAGFLEGLYHEKHIDICLKQGLAASTICRLDITPSASIQPLEKCFEFCEKLQPE